MPLKPVPATGTLTASILENEALGIRRRMYFSVSVPVTVPHKGKTRATEVFLDLIRLDADGCDDLDGKTYWFPVNPAAGYIEGYILLEGEDHAVDCTRIAFGTLKGDRVPVELSLRIEFVGTGDSGESEELVLRTGLAFDRKELERVFAESLRPV